MYARSITITVIMLLALVAVCLPAAAAEEADGSEAVKAQGVCVVELFSSEGCSSCPPAEDAMKKIAQAAAPKKLPVFVLAYHVDIWDRLGWKDPFASQAASRRMRDYLDGRGLTPLFVVNGSPVKGNTQSLQTAMRQALVKAGSVDVTLEAPEVDGAKLTVPYKLDGELPEDGVLIVALVERNVDSHVLRGENTGLLLHHWNVVRDFETKKSPQADGNVTLQVPEDARQPHMSVIAYVQQGKKGEVVGAARHDFAEVTFPDEPADVEPVAAPDGMSEALTSEYLSLRHPQDWKAAAQGPQAMAVSPKKTVVRIMPIPVMNKTKVEDLNDAAKLLKKHVVKGGKMVGKPESTTLGADKLKAQRMQFTVKQKGQTAHVEATVALTPAGVPYMAAIFSQNADADYSVAHGILETLRFRKAEEAGQ